MQIPTGTGLENTVQWKKPDTHGHILYDFVYMKSPEQAVVQKQKVDQWAGGGGGTGLGSDCLKGLRDDETVLKFVW